MCRNIICTHMIWPEIVRPGLSWVFLYFVKTTHIVLVAEKVKSFPAELLSFSIAVSIILWALSMFWDLKSSPISATKRRDLIYFGRSWKALWIARSNKVTLKGAAWWTPFSWFWKDDEQCFILTLKVRFSRKFSINFSRRSFYPNWWSCFKI